MKTKKCIKKGLRLIKIGLKKATSYKIVKSRLGYRWYSDDLLKQRQNYTYKDL